MPQSSWTSWRSAAASAQVVEFEVGDEVGDGERMRDVGVAGTCGAGPSWQARGELVGLADNAEPFGGQILGGAQEHGVDGDGG